MISRFCIDRPIFAAVISIVIVIVGSHDNIAIGELRLKMKGRANK